jgi:hypothetical protein
LEALVKDAEVKEQVWKREKSKLEEEYQATLERERKTVKDLESKKCGQFDNGPH